MSEIKPEFVRSISAVKDKLLPLAKKIISKTWAVIPVLIAGLWICLAYISISDDAGLSFMICIAMLVLDCIGICTLFKNRKQLGDIHQKRVLLLIFNIIACLIFLLLSSPFSLHESYLTLNSFFFNLFFVFAPPLLSIRNIMTYIKNCSDKKIIWALIFTDPLMHYMGVYLCFRAYSN